MVELPSDISFAMFLATVQVSDFNDYEWHLFMHHKRNG